MAESPLPAISPLHGLLEVSRLVRAEGELPELLRAIARTIAASLGYRTVAINLYRPAWDDFEVTTVHGNEHAREALIGRLQSSADWSPILADRFLRHGAYVLLAGDFDWTLIGQSYIPDVEPGAGGEGWHPEDALFLPMRHSAGHLLGIISVDEPLSGRRPTDADLEVLVALADHAAQAVESSQEVAEAARHRLALEQLLSISSRLIGEPLVDEILRAVCHGVREALGFENVVALLHDRSAGTLHARAVVGRELAEIERGGPLHLSDVEKLLDPRYELEGCYLLTRAEARRRMPDEPVRYLSERNGRGPWAWNHHWLTVPLLDSDGDVIGILQADDPDDRLLPSSEKLQALRVFANQASAAIVASERRSELRFLADHDPLTRLLNRRAFVARLGDEVARADRYRRVFGLVLCDLDGFKGLNDEHGHIAGDEVLQAFARTLERALRRPDDAFRIGGDEFALILAEASEAHAREVVERIVELLRASDDTRLAGLGASFGAAAYPGEARDADALLRRADEALYRAKRDGSLLRFAA